MQHTGRDMQYTGINIILWLNIREKENLNVRRYLSSRVFNLAILWLLKLLVDTKFRENGQNNALIKLTSALFQFYILSRKRFCTQKIDALVFP